MSQFLILAVLASFIIGRLVGTRLSFAKQIGASLLSVVVTSAIFWFTYVRDHPSSSPGINEMWWLISIVIVSMLFYLLLEMFDPLPLGERGDRLSESRNPLARLLAWKKWPG